MNNASMSNAYTPAYQGYTAQDSAGIGSTGLGIPFPTSTIHYQTNRTAFNQANATAWPTRATRGRKRRHEDVEDDGSSNGDGVRPAPSRRHATMTDQGNGSLGSEGHMVYTQEPTLPNPQTRPSIEGLTMYPTYPNILPTLLKLSHLLHRFFKKENSTNTTEASNHIFPRNLISHSHN
ncbi:hypothetical protein K449DRAFT_422269 [Hypoxylon sp. EC38]|nr:hypothetical protein K449DRAFT_422269 [Hypoxylon sp. EC38]